MKMIMNGDHKDYGENPLVLQKGTTIINESVILNLMSLFG
jgi:hypothetical protein